MNTETQGTRSFPRSRSSWGRPSMVRRFSPLIAGALLVSAGGCGGASAGAFSETFPDADEGGIRALATRLEGAPPRDEPGVLVGVVARGSEKSLFVWDVAQARIRWSVAAEPESPPFIAGDSIVTTEGDDVVVRDLANGAVRTRVPDEQMHLVGADGEGGRLAFVLSTGGGTSARTHIVLVENGGVRWIRSADHAVGAPAVHAGLVLVPWARQNLSVLDALTGDELWRARVTDDVIGHAFVDGRSAYVGQAGVFRITPSLASGTKTRAAYLTLPTADLPGRPGFMTDAYLPPATVTSATVHVRLVFRPAGDGDSVTLVDGVAYLVFYKQIFALEPRPAPETGYRTRWVRELPADIVAAQLVPGGILLADEAGGLRGLDAHDGREAFHAELGVTPEAATFGGTTWPAVSGTGDAAPPLRDQLLAAADSTDARLVPARLFAVQQLATLADPEVTANLVALCESSRAPAAVKTIACRAVSEHANGRGAILAALERHASFLRGTTAPPVGALASAAARVGERGAVPLLLAQLRDPATAETDLAPLALALRDLGDHSAAQPLESFIQLYHAELTSETGIAAIAAAMDALVRLEAASATDLLTAVKDDPLAPASTRGHAADALDAIAHANDEAHARDVANEPTPDAQTPPVGADTRPAALTAQHLERALLPVRAQLTQCMLADARHPMSVRLVVIADGNGHISAIHATDAQECIAAVVQPLTLPATHGRDHQQLTYTVRR